MNTNFPAAGAETGRDIALRCPGPQAGRKGSLVDIGDRQTKIIFFPRNALIGLNSLE